MTAADTLEYAQTTADQLERGIDFIQDRLAQAQDLAIRVDELSAAASDVAAKARRGSKYALIIAGIAVVGVAVFIAIRKCPMTRPEAGPTEEPTNEASDEVAD